MKNNVYMLNQLQCV